MWGYPTKGRGQNITNIFHGNNLKNLIQILQSYNSKKYITSEILCTDLKSIKGLGISTMSKFAYFLGVEIDGLRSLILDLKIIEVINQEKFEEINTLKGISHSNAPRKYTEYLRLLAALSDKLNVQPDQIEMFLFIFGQNLSNPH